MPKDNEGRNALLGNLARVLVTLNADVGVLMDPEGERLTVVDNLGRVIDDITLTAVFATLMAGSEHSVIGLPVTSPQAFEAVVGASGGQVVRTRTDIRALMAKACRRRHPAWL